MVVYGRGRAWVCGGLALWVLAGSWCVALATRETATALDSNGSVALHGDGDDGGNNKTCPDETDHHGGGVRLASLRWREVGVYYTITAFVIIAGLAKLLFHHMHWVSSKVPESCVLVILGVALGLLVYFTAHKTTPTDSCHYHVPLPHFTSDKFFFVLLPPIVLESAYSLHDRAFFDNLGTVLVFALVGTIFNIFTIGPTLYGLNALGAMGNISFTFSEGLVFSSLISAVDPVAVLAIFQELGVNKDLYFLVFGESLLNDGVTVVVYNTMQSFMAQEGAVGAEQYALAVAAVAVVVFGGALIGVVFGFITAFITKYTTDVRVVEPLALLALSYLSYLTAELFHFSGIISLIVCGLIQAHYAFQNISQKSYTCVKYFTKMASATSDTVIFMFLGMVLVSDEHLWHTGFVLWTLALCIIFRFIGVFVLTGIMNHYRVKKVGLEEQFIAAYGGLRGAVSFSLVNMLDESMGPRRIFVTTTLVVILFTIFIQGTTIKPLVSLLQIQRASHGRKHLGEEINNTTMDHIMAGVEEILGQHGDFYLRELLVHYNDKYLRKWFLRPTVDSKLKRLFEKIAISEHYAHLYGPVAMIEERVKPLCHTKMPSKRVRSDSFSMSHQDELLLQPRMNMEGEMFEDIESKSATGSDIELRQHHPGPLLPLRQSKVGSIDLQRQDSATTQTQDANVLRKALRNNPYNKLHYKYNRNLVGEEDQELEEHLERRRLNARRMTRLASSTRLPPSSAGFTNAGGRRNTMLESHDLTFGAAELVERHNVRRRTMSARPRVGSVLSSHQASALHRPIISCFSSPDPTDSTPASPAILMALQEASDPLSSLPDIRPWGPGSGPPKDQASTPGTTESSLLGHESPPSGFTSIPESQTQEILLSPGSELSGTRDGEEGEMVPLVEQPQSEKGSPSSPEALKGMIV
ncbi:hypothetical protein Pmani_024464 [Petrolisthes manimaculis]|uniref:Sodium/hydrogen exchanger n=1 Tax=Petrolisthes manimaculis TaxID=1843537 RepID=A0AAE1P8P9_9EUCA|nr:hypothetical protein Pmani_024464 [Petrolisthes manimaculis]